MCVEPHPGAVGVCSPRKFICSEMDTANCQEKYPVENILARHLLLTRLPFTTYSFTLAILMQMSKHNGWLAGSEYCSNVFFLHT